jgi:hypothetical protein
VQQQDDGARPAPSPWVPPDAAPAPQGWRAPDQGRGAPDVGSPWTSSPPPAWPDRDPREARRRRLRAVAALASVVGLLVVGLLVSEVLEDRRQQRISAQVTALLPDLLAFVEQERGLPFLEEVDVEVLDDDSFLDALYEADPEAEDPREDRDAGQTLTALGLLDEDVDLDEAVADSLDEGVVGFYDPTSGRLAVRGREVDAFAQLVLVHELTHALQDQHFDIDRPELDRADDERAIAFTSLVEGDAVRVETAWLQAQPQEVQRQLADSFAAFGGGGEPVVESLLSFPYVAGPALVLALLERGGQEALDAAFRDPPTTTEQVLDPDAGSVAEVPRPDVDGEVLDEGVLGVLGLALLLEVDPLTPGVERGWNGDRYVTVEQDGRTCTTAHLVADDPGAGAALAAELQAWAGERPDADVATGPAGALRLESCVS